MDIIKEVTGAYDRYIRRVAYAMTDTDWLKVDMAEVEYYVMCDMGGFDPEKVAIALSNGRNLNETDVRA